MKNHRTIETKQQRYNNVIAELNEEDRTIERKLRMIQPFREPFQKLDFGSTKVQAVLDENIKSGNTDYKSEIAFWKNEYTNFMEKTTSSLSLHTYAYSNRPNRIEDATCSTCIDLQQQGWMVTKCGIKRNDQWEHRIEIEATKN
ncbi:MAG: hypothetical protein EOP45_21090 [Sphingobacteriaceae bacterium]|nr:MAG: hypothetical protein EOP45_21090 [Sphingobacteriaceae bacterium]